MPSRRPWPSRPHRESSVSSQAPTKDQLSSSAGLPTPQAVSVIHVREGREPEGHPDPHSDDSPSKKE